MPKINVFEYPCYFICISVPLIKFNMSAGLLLWFVPFCNVVKRRQCRSFIYTYIVWQHRLQLYQPAFQIVYSSFVSCTAWSVWWPYSRKDGYGLMRRLCSPYIMLQYVCRVIIAKCQTDYVWVFVWNRNALPFISVLLVKHVYKMRQMLRFFL